MESTLKPISEMCEMVESNPCVDKMNTMVSEEMNSIKKAERSRWESIIDSEIKTLIGTQEKTTEEIKKKLTEIQTLKEHNLVISGAISGLKKVRGQS